MDRTTQGRGDWDELEAVYYQIKHLIMIILLLGVGTIVILWDVQGAYRTLNAKRHNWHLQVSWLLNSRGAKQYFVDLVNPFGRIELQRNWEAVAGSIEWILHELGLFSVVISLTIFMILSGPKRVSQTGKPRRKGQSGFSHS
jgi:hypothetical protein